MQLFTKLWKKFCLRDAPQPRKKPRSFVPRLEAFEERLVPAVPAPALGLISGTAFVDANKNGVIDSGEKAVTGLVVTLTGKTTANATVNISTKTDALGNFTFSQLQPGTYNVTRGLGNNIVSTSSSGNLGGNKGNGNITNISLAAGQAATGYLFAVRGITAQGLSLRQFLSTNPVNGSVISSAPGTGQTFGDNQAQPPSTSDFGNPTASTLTGWVFKDDNNDGTQQGAEVGITGVELALTGLDDTGKAIFLKATTDSNGFYQFNIARPGSYTVQILKQPSGFKAGNATAGTLGGQAVRNNQIFGIPIVAGSTGTDYRFGQLVAATPTPNAAKPVLVGELLDDTIGPTGTNSDKITSDATIVGSIVGTQPITKLLGTFAASGTPNLNLSATLLPGGKFLINQAQLAALSNGTLSQGAHTLRLRAIDSQGRQSDIVDVAFTFDSVAPTIPTLVLDAGSDDGTAGDGRTSLGTVTVSGTTTAGATVDLYQGTSLTPVATTTAAAGGTFSFANITLANGVNNFIVRSRDVAGNLSQFENFFVKNQAPTTTGTNPLDNLSVAQNASPSVIDLANNFTDADMTNSIIRLVTNFGNIDIELFDTATPETVANFLNYINSAKYDGTVFHRLVNDFVLQGGGFKINSPTSFTSVVTDPSVRNEFGLSNLAGTLAMAKVGSDPNSATSQFFFNLDNNGTTGGKPNNLDTQNGGFTVFAKILSGADMRVINTMATTPIQNRSSTNSAFNEMPVKPGTPVVNNNFLVITKASVLRQTESLSYSVVNNTNTGLVTTAVVNNRLTLTYTAAQTGSATITVRATDKFGATVDRTFTVNVGTANTAPIALTTTVSTAKNTAIDIDLFPLVSDDNTSDDNLVFSLGTSPTNGTITLNPDGHTIHFVPKTDFTGTVTFTYTAFDGGTPVLNSGATTITVNVTP